MEDVKKICIEQNCGQEFILTGGEREFFQDKSMPEPRRCKNCRKQRKASQTPLQGGVFHPTGGEHQNHSA